MRDVVLLLWFAISMPIAFFRPFYGILVFTLLAFNRTQDLCWGVARDLSLSQLIALVTIVGFVLNHRGKYFISDKRNWLMILLFAWVGVSVYTAYYPSAAITKFPEMGKVILIACMTASLLTTRKRFRILMIVTSMSLGFYGIKNALIGTTVNRGPGGLLQDNNDFSSALVMALPMLYYIAIDEKKRWQKVFFAFATVCTCITVMLTDSRGGFLAMATVFGALVMMSRKKLLAVSMIPIVVAAFFLFVPQRYLDRISSISDTQEASSKGRLVAWANGLRMIKDRPITGVGYRNFVYVYHFYTIDKNEQRRVAHNSYIQVAAESGLPAFFIFMTLIAYTVYRLRALRRRVRGEPGTEWVVNYSRALEVSIYGYMMGAMFLNRAHFDLYYHVVAMSIALDVLAREQLAKALVPVTDAPPRTESSPFLLPEPAS